MGRMAGGADRWDTTAPEPDGCEELGSLVESDTDTAATECDTVARGMPPEGVPPALGAVHRYHSRSTSSTADRPPGTSLLTHSIVLVPMDALPGLTKAPT